MTDDITTTPDPDTNKHERYQAAPSHHFKWNVDVRVDGHDVYHGFIKDVTMQSVHLYLDHNLQNAKFVKLHIHIPPLELENPHHILEVTGNITSTIYDSGEDFFRSGIDLLDFTFESDREYLQSRLAAS